MPPRAATLQVLVAGNTYNRSYWQADLEPATYSYVRRANLAGYATLAIDRLGTGASLHPKSADMTFGNDVATMHEVVTAARAGAFGGFRHVVGVGHSLGSIVVNQTAGAHPGDFDAVVLTGFSHSINVLNAAARVAPRYAAAAGDPRFSGLGLDASYVTAQPGGREAFYAAGMAGAAVLAWDERTRDLANLVEIAGFATFQIPNVSKAIETPVFVVNGSQDAVACGAAAADCTSSQTLQAAERSWFGPRAAVTAWAVPGLGHAVTMHGSAGAVNAVITTWIDRTVGPGSAARASTPGTIPTGPPTPPATTDPAARAANQALLATTPLAADTYDAAVHNLPGLGDGTNPYPAYTDLLRTLANLPNPPRTTTGTRP